MAICGDSGILGRARVIATLKDELVDVYSRDEGSQDEYVLAKDSVMEVQALPEFLPRRFIHRLSRRFGIPIERFYQSRV